ncbi:hypothetical protein L226DRAFT_102137 [Lentinus tigrinus ALCF2SS1-7]|uniref:F-box domain-containing protein n=1 Tax=Lentinus tigrinus ALCF2SS1-6 TaxID=1328759 RepID=A0A5C2S7D1_9APHY|nr:hypothetical protein L227DRAFT_165793 [Lentinus tigrinus ALCF2SS1-6]RPD73546.1 hypothetical protein L226DRAFT_102137 [Lentinus tigrinus ALCF2SS1-7]
MPPYIPTEITDAIVSAVHGAHTLAMCALVCRAWLPRSRAKLFTYIRIQDEQTYTLLVERVVRAETMSPYLASVNSFYLGRYDMDRLSQLARLFFVEFAGKLPGLRSLFLQSIDFTHQRPSVKWPLLLSQFSTITTLMLSNCRFSAFNDARRLLTALPLLSSLEIDDVTWPTVSHERHLQTTLRSRTCWPELNQLHIRDLSPQCIGTFLKWMTAALAGSPVKVLTLCFSNLPSTGTLREIADTFVGCVGSSVTDLAVDLTDILPLSGFVALENLSLSDWHGYLDNWQGVASVLQGVSSNTIQSIKFHPIHTLKRHSNSNNDPTFFHFDHDNLEELDRVLSGERFGNLREVILDVIAGDEESKELLCAHGRRCLPELRKRKILQLYINYRLQCLDVD